MLTLNIDGKEIRATEESTILDVARENNIEIPSLCYYESVSPAGACRLCLVEIIKGGRSRLVASCCYPVEEGLVVKTNTEMVTKIRKGIVELLLARCPESKVIQDVAQQMGIRKSRFKPKNEECILCGLCTRVCREVVGVSAISLVNRGITKEVATPFLEPSTTCIGCGSCAQICPTGAIKIEDKDGIRTIHNWDVKFELQKCKLCNNYFAPKAQQDFLRKKLNLPEDVLEVCPNCALGVPTTT